MVPGRAYCERPEPSPAPGGVTRPVARFAVWLRGDRAVVFAGLVAAIVLAWVYFFRGTGLETGGANPGSGRMMAMTPAWTAGHGARVFLMWAATMAAMMLPGAAPAVLTVAGLPQGAGEAGGASAAALFTAGSVGVWIASGAVAVLAQWALDRAAILPGGVAGRGSATAGLVVFAMGLWQFAPWKQVCLRRCRSPHVSVVPTPGGRGPATVAAGVRYGVVSLGCCGTFMGLMFVAGTMTAPWVASLTLTMLAEQCLPWTKSVRCVLGVTGLAWGGVVIAAALV